MEFSSNIVNCDQRKKTNDVVVNYMNKTCMFIFQYIPPPPPQTEDNDDQAQQVEVDLDEEFEAVLSTASEDEIVDLAGILYIIHIFLSLSIRKIVASVSNM